MVSLFYFRFGDTLSIVLLILQIYVIECIVFDAWISCCCLCWSINCCWLCFMHLLHWLFEGTFIHEYVSCWTYIYLFASDTWDSQTSTYKSPIGFTYTSAAVTEWYGSSNACTFQEVNCIRIWGILRNDVGCCEVKLLISARFYRHNLTWLLTSSWGNRGGG